MILEFLSFMHFSMVDLLDIVLVGFLIYMLIHWFKGSSAMNIFIAIIILLVVRVASGALGMKMLSSVLETVIDVGAIALIVIFQPEIRRFLNNLGRSAGNTIERRHLIEKFLPSKDKAYIGESASSEIAQACKEMAEGKVGALIVIRHRDMLDDIISTGDILDARISNRLIRNIFFKNAPMHDGAMVIAEGRILASRCTLPITDRTDLPANFGMRHKAAVGLTEMCDADVVVVSEQTGRISFVREGVVNEVKGFNALKLMLMGGKEEKK